MAKSSITFKGAPKPYGATGHFDEPRRHALQAKGIKTGHLADQAVYEQYGIQNLEKGSPALRKVPETSQGLEDIEAEAIEEKKGQPKKISFSERVKSLEQSFAESMRRERALKSQHRREEVYLKLGKELPEPKPEEQEEEEESEQEYDSESLPAKLGTFLADVTDDYTSEDLVGLNDKELEMLAVRFKSETKDNMSLFGDPENPFVAELKKRIEARDELAKEKAQIRAELRHPKKEEGLFDGLL